MYDGIFEDVEYVKEVLAGHGHNLVDETLVFELLEDLKVADHVVKVLLGSRRKLNPNPDLSLSQSTDLQPNPQTTSPEGAKKPLLRYALDDSNSSDSLQVLEHKIKNAVQDDNEAVDLTMDDNHSSSSSIASEKSNSKQIMPQIKEPEAVPSSLIDLTTEMIEVKQDCCRSENFRDTNDLKVEELDGNNSTTDSEFEMDSDYYTRRDMESEDSDGFGESDDKASHPPSPALTVCPDFVIPVNNEAPLIKLEENRMEEMLEENNNDPNNNLEDIEELGQNNGAATAENLNVEEKEPVEEKCESPKPGCSKDSYYADTDFCMTEGAANNGNQKFVVGKRPNIANIFKDEDFLVGNCVRLSDTDIGKEVFMIQKILPHFTKAKILSTIVENQEAINRVELALWELLPDDKPAPIFHPKRKQKEDNCPAPIKKSLHEDSKGKKNPEAGFDQLVPKAEAAGAGFKASILKPATLKVPETKKHIIKPSTLEYKISKPLPPANTILKSKTVTLKPSKLEHLSTLTNRNTAACEAKIPNTTSDQAVNLISRTYARAPSRENKAAGSDFSKIGAIPKMPKQTTPLILTQVEKKVKDSEQSTAQKPPAAPKITSQLGATHKDYKILKYQFPKITVAKNHEDPIKLNVQNTGAISKNVAVKIKSLKESVAAARTGMKLGSPEHLQKLFKATIHVGKNSEQSQSKSSKIPSEVQVPKANKAACYGQGQAAALPVSHKSELNMKPVVPWAMETAASAHVGGIRNERMTVNHPYSWMSGHNLAYNDTNARLLQIADRISFGNIELQFQDLLANRLPNHVEAPKDENGVQPLPVLHPDEIDFELFSTPAPGNAVPPAVAERIEPARKERMEPAIKERIEPARKESIEPARKERLEPARKERIEKQDIPPPKELFNPLLNMFPDVDPNYIAELCISAKLRNKGLESLVEVLLDTGIMYPRVINPEPEPQEMNPDVQYENLQGIFPDAHPEYLRTIAEKYYNDPEAMKRFVQTQLENHDYPTMADYLKKIKITEQIRQYTVDFSAEKFLEIFPNPMHHFENPKRIYRFNVIAFEFLKNHFRLNKVATIQKAYKCHEHQFHISLAAKSLELIGPEMKSKRPDKPLPIEDIPLLQEFAYIRHKAEIKSLIAAQEEKEKQEFKRLKKMNQLVECQCCYDGECMPSKCMECSEGHLFCKSCIKTGSETKIGEGQTQFPCFVECKGEFTLPVLQKVLEPTMFSILLRKRQEEEVKAAALEGLVSCPFCHFASIPPPEDKVFKCLNPECMKETCRLCKELNHVPLRCDEVSKGEEARHYLEEKMTAALVRKCYRCSRPFFKDEGCNKMTCPCGAMTCYICGEPVRDYRHFNGQGSDRTDLCPLWSDNKVLNAQTVRVVAQAAEKEILKKNPHLKIDAQALMPSMPQASRGPHQDIANAHILPIQARRV